DEAGNGGSVPANVRNVTVDNSCFNTGRPDAVTVDVDHGSRTFFSGIFGIDIAPDIGAHAKACAGSVQAPNGLVPIEINTSMALCFEDEDGDGENDPQIGEPCPMEFGSNNNPQGSNPRGILDLQAPGDYCSDASGSGDLEDLIEFGAPGTCLINETGSCDPGKNGPWYDCVAVQTGNPTKVARAFRDRIAREGACDSDGDGIEQFDEVVTLVFDAPGNQDDVYEARDCEPNTDGDQISPRLITIIVLDQIPDPGNVGYPIYAFAGMYVMGCTQESDLGSLSDLDPFCDTPGNFRAPTAGERSVSFVSFPSGNQGGGQCGRGNRPTCTPVPSLTPTQTPTPGAPQPTPTPDDGGQGGGGGQGHKVVWGTFVNLIFAGHEAGPPTDATSLFGISLKE
ncbi:MAG TPA: hypothetical protein VNM91_11560, partial [Dehalococcoidia bacterium]|nr:hypothetical protein [Dehalococcoidia bacterium]